MRNDERVQFWPISTPGRASIILQKETGGEHRLNAATVRRPFRGNIRVTVT